MERFLHYAWQHHLYPSGLLQTVEGHRLEIINPGLHNTDAGPDFFNAQIRLDGETLAGNVEIHAKSSDWYHHAHDGDARYNNVVLHVVQEADREVYTAAGRRVPQFVLRVPPDVVEHYHELLRQEQCPPCRGFAVQLPRVAVRGWLDALAVERLEQKTNRINDMARRFGGDWERVAFITLARSFGFGINAEAFEQWAENIPLMSVGKHRDNLFQVEAIFMGQAGLLDDDMLPLKRRGEALAEGYWPKIQKEYRFLAHKFTLKPMPGHLWRFLRLRPQNFPYIRLSQLAQLYYSRRYSLSAVCQVRTLADARSIVETYVTPYWQTHYVFGSPTPPSDKALRDSSLDSVVINAVVPLLFAYGRHSRHSDYEDCALRLLSEIKPERNHITEGWIRAGLHPDNAADSQALIRLQRDYCDRKDCLRCRFGREYLTSTGVYHVLNENQEEKRPPLFHQNNTP